MRAPMERKQVELWPWIGFASGLFCVVRGTADLRARRFAWGAIGIAAGLGLLLSPVPTYGVRLERVAPATH